jgi:hypothetical protein
LSLDFAAPNLPFGHLTVSTFLITRSSVA